jgi:RNA polymerase sigma factor (TIGR02999 family)
MQPAGVDEAQAPDAVANQETLDVWFGRRTREMERVERQHSLYALGEGRPQLDDHPAPGPGRIQSRRRVLGDYRRAGGQRQHHQTCQRDIPPSSDGLLACAPRHNRLHVTLPLRSDRCSSHVKPHPNGSKGGPGEVAFGPRFPYHPPDPSTRATVRAARDLGNSANRATPGEITSLLQAWGRGDEAARDRLAGIVYADLRRLAGARLRRGAAPTLNPSDLVHEAVIRLIGQTAHFESRAHFFGVAAVMIRRVLVDHARARRARKRGGAAVRVDLSKANAAVAPRDVDLVALDEALAELEKLDAEQARVVELRYFGGLTFDEIAEATGISVSTAKRSWASARLWLLWRLGGRG